jgi:hypothetical protein
MYKTRYCPDCQNRELEKYQRFCSECAYIRQTINVDCAVHTYRQTEKYYSSLAKSNEKRKQNGYFAEYNRTEKRKEYQREYQKNRLEYKREWQKSKREKKAAGIVLIK